VPQPGFEYDAQMTYQVAVEQGVATGEWAGEELDIRQFTVIEFDVYLFFFKWLAVLLILQIKRT
jgi:hypothetical protein